MLGPVGLDGTDVRLGRRDRVVISVLAMHAGETVTVDRLVDAVWGETPPSSAPKVVQGCVMRLRKTLGRSAIETSEHGYTLAIADDEVDAQRFEQMVVRGRELLALGESDRAAYVLGEALALWRGQPYVDLEGWHHAVIESGRLEGLRLDAEELKVQAALELGHHREVISEAHKMVQAAPMRERRWALLAHAQYQAGRQEEALRTIHQVKSLLTQRLGLDPGHDLIRLEQAILRQDESLVVPGSGTAASDTCPYQGLMPYDVGDAESFFGREANLSACLATLTDVSTVTVVGPSGSGKSSLVRAGVAAALRRRGRAVVVITPGVHPMQALSRLPTRGALPVLVIDQCEEMFSLCDDVSERAEFVAAVAQHAEAGLLVMALRADRLADVATHPALARLVEQGMHLLGGMSEDDLREAIVSPARQVGLVIEPGLVDLLLRDVQDEPGALPLLSHALLETWKRREGNTMTVDGYRATGAIRGAVAQSAERVYVGMQPEQRHLLRDLLLRLVTHGVEGEPVRSRVPRRLIGSDPEIDQLIDELVAARLVSSDAGVLEVSHEALARAWPRLHAWLEDDIEGQRILHHLTGAADSWDSMHRPDSELYRGVRLAQAIEWRDRQGTHLTDTEVAFLEASAQIAQTEEHAAEERARVQAQMIRRLRGVLVVAATLLIVALVAGALAVRQADRADSNAAAAADNAAAATDAALAADARRVGARALATDDIDTSMLLAVAGARMDDSSATRSNLLAVLSQRPQLVRSTTYNGDVITGLEVSPDGQSLAVYDRRSQVTLYDATTWDALHTSPGTARVPYKWFAPMAFSPDGDTLAVGGPPLSRVPIRMLDGQTLEPLPVQLPDLPSQGVRVADITYSADGSAMAGVIQRLRRTAAYWDVVGADLFVWDLSQSEGADLRLHKKSVCHVDFGYRCLTALSPKGDTVYTSTPLTAYDVASQASLFSEAPAVYAWGVERRTNFFDLSPDGTLLAMAEDPDRLTLRDASSGEVRRVLHGHGESVLAVRFSQDGTLLATSSPDRTAIIWDVATGEVRERLDLGEGEAQGLAFGPDDTTLYSGGADRAIREWDLKGDRRFVSESAEPAEDTFTSITPSPGARFLSSWAFNGLRFYDMADREWTRMVGRNQQHLGVTWDSHGAQFASVGKGFIQLWDPTTATARQSSLDGEFAGVRFSPDDSRIAVLSSAGKASMLDAETLEPVGAPVQLEVSGGAVSLGADNRTALLLSPGYVTDFTFEHYSRNWVIVDLESGRLVRQGELGFEASWLASSPDGRHAVITGRAGELVVLDLASGKPVGPPVVGHGAEVWTIQYSLDGSSIVTAGTDGSVSLWDGRTGELLGTVALPEQSFASAVFGADEQTVVIATGNQGVYLWNTRASYAIDFACRLAGRDLTQPEWAEAFGDRPYQETCPQI